MQDSGAVFANVLRVLRNREHSLREEGRFLRQGQGGEPVEGPTLNSVSL